MSELQQRFHYNNHDDTWGIESFQDVSSYIRANKDMYNANQLNIHSKSKDALMGWHKASIPDVFWHGFMKEYQNMIGAPIPPTIKDEGFQKFIQQKLRDPTWRALRVDGRKD